MLPVSVAVTCMSSSDQVTEFAKGPAGSEVMCISRATAPVSFLPPGTRAPLSILTRHVPASGSFPVASLTSPGGFVCTSQVIRDAGRLAVGTVSLVLPLPGCDPQGRGPCGCPRPLSGPPWPLVVYWRAQVLEIRETWFLVFCFVLGHFVSLLHRLPQLRLRSSHAAP